MNRGDQVETPYGPGRVDAIDWRTVWLFGRPRNEGRVWVTHPDGTRHVYHSGQVYPLQRYADQQKED